LLSVGPQLVSRDAAFARPENDAGTVLQKLNGKNPRPEAKPGRL
jgi:hypothetical protein